MIASGVIRWEDLPPMRSDRVGQTRGRLDHELIVDQLKRRPGQWAVVYEGPVMTSLGTHIRSGKYRYYQPKGSFEAVYRYLEGNHRVYVRYVGGAP